MDPNGQNNTGTSRDQGNGGRSQLGGAARQGQRGSPMYSTDFVNCPPANVFFLLVTLFLFSLLVLISRNEISSYFFVLNFCLVFSL